MITVPPKKIFAVITDPYYITKWDYCGWARNDMRLAGKLRKRDEEGTLIESEIVVWEPPCRFAILTPMIINPEEPKEGHFTARLEFAVEAAEGKSVLKWVRWSGDHRQVEEKNHLRRCASGKRLR